jgi:hypothetical protein
MMQVRAPILIKSFDDVSSKLHSLKAGDMLVLETVKRGQKANQSLASFAKPDGRTSLNVVINWDVGCEPVLGIVIRVETTQVSSKVHQNGDQEYRIFARYLEKYEGDDFPLHAVKDVQYCWDNIEALCTAGTRITLKVDALCCFDNQCICSFYDNEMFMGIRFILSNAMGADDSWVGKTVQATVKHSQSTDKGYTINCTFVRCVPTPAEGSQKQAKSTAASHRPANLRAADEHIFAQQRQDEQERQLRGEAAEYNLDIDLLTRLKEMGFTEPEDLHLYSRYKHFLEQDYNVYTLKRDYPEVHAMWAFTALQEVRDRDAYQGITLVFIPFL